MKAPGKLVANYPPLFVLGIVVKQGDVLTFHRYQIFLNYSFHFLVLIHLQSNRVGELNTEINIFHSLVDFYSEFFLRKQNIFPTFPCSKFHACYRKQKQFFARSKYFMICKNYISTFMQSSLILKVKLKLLSSRPCIFSNEILIKNRLTNRF